jgi:hypothetical protein
VRRPAARDRARELARLVRKSLGGVKRTDDQRRNYIRGYWNAAIKSDPDLIDHRDIYFEEAQS